MCKNPALQCGIFVCIFFVNASWGGHGYSNPDGFRHENLNLVCLPIPSCPHKHIIRHLGGLCKQFFSQLVARKALCAGCSAPATPSVSDVFSPKSGGPHLFCRARCAHRADMGGSGFFKSGVFSKKAAVFMSNFGKSAYASDIQFP